MLQKFTVENYKSFEKPLCLDFTKVSDYQYNTDCIKNELLNKIIIFGTNGCGKSNLGLALFDIIQVLTDKQLNSLMLDEDSFLNFNRKSDYAKFEYLFLIDDREIEYSYSKKAPTVLAEESLTIDGEILFEVNLEEELIMEFHPEILGAPNFITEGYHWDISFARYLRTNASTSNNVLKSLFAFVESMLWFRSLENRNYIGFTKGGDGMSEWIIKNNYIEDFQRFLKDMAGLDFNLKAVISEEDVPGKTLYVQGKESLIPFYPNASTGTRALMLLFYWTKQFSKVKFLFMDEFDAFYHFELSKKIVETIRDNNKDLQAVFTSHNTSLATNELLRPDCYFTLVNGEIKSFKDRTSRELRESHNLEKLLRSGEFDED